MNYLKDTDIVKINAKVIAIFSPKEEIIVKDAEALKMSIELPKQTFDGEELYKNIHEKAAILFINIANRHCFNNGNKRTAWVSLITFYIINGYNTSFPKEEGIRLTLDIVNSNSKGESFDSLKDRTVEYLKTSKYIYKI